MPSVDDVAAAVLEEGGEMSTMKLQKLVYYAQAWHLVWDDEPLFPEPIEAWAGGPVIRHLHNRHRGRYMVSEWPEGNSGRLSESERETVAAVVQSYGALSGNQLSTLTHREDPWIDARNGVRPGARSDCIIPVEAIHEYYSRVAEDEDAEDVSSFAAR